MDASEESLQYPIGRFRWPKSLTPAEVSGWIDDIAGLPSALRGALDGLREERLDTPYREGGWTVRQVAHHIADSHLNAYCRIRLAVTEDEPTIRPYDEKAWAELGDAKSGPIDVSVALVDALHTRWTALARSLSEADLKRAYRHPEHPRPMAVDATLAMYSWHGKHHVAHITSLRERQTRT